MRKPIIIVASVLVLISVIFGWVKWRQHGFNESKIAHRANLVDFESDMTEVLAREIFQELQTRHPSVFFLAFGDHLTPPDSKFIYRFKDVQPEVRSFQASILSPNGLILDKHNGRTGFIIQIITIKPFITGTFDVEVAICEGNSKWEPFIYRVTDLAGEYKVKSRKPE